MFQLSSFVLSLCLAADLTLRCSGTPTISLLCFCSVLHSTSLSKCPFVCLSMCLLLLHFCCGVSLFSVLHTHTHMHTIHTCTPYTHAHHTHMHTIHTCTTYTHARTHTHTHAHHTHTYTCTPHTHMHTTHTCTHTHRELLPVQTNSPDRTSVNVHDPVNCSTFPGNPLTGEFNDTNGNPICPPATFSPAPPCVSGVCVCVCTWWGRGGEREREGGVVTSSVCLSCHLQSTGTILCEHMCVRKGGRNEGGCDVWLIYCTYLSLLHTKKHT